MRRVMLTLSLTMGACGPPLEGDCFVSPYLLSKTLGGITCNTRLSRLDLPIVLSTADVDGRVARAVARSINRDVGLRLVTADQEASGTFVPVVYDPLEGGYNLGTAQSDTWNWMVQDASIQLWEGMRGSRDEWFILKHEAYHVLGLAHVHEFCNIMYPDGIRPGCDGISSIQRRSLHILYGPEGGY